MQARRQQTNVKRSTLIKTVKLKSKLSKNTFSKMEGGISIFQQVKHEIIIARKLSAQIILKTFFHAIRN